ncbi:uncharacterized protein LOC127291117 [Leptopilina boulardi]|uniref:uncharacterized protein LOC127284170 n=1 Tax=Leptopilina boulardi TaxID=63433 RepID=UPI0021F573CD|nr:uncharacterized protein LOC127284170 [Leptopilina boulardi]XP_051175994.1 uncharacterized protein LOC127291117 [Leptopilina boulardi]
MSDQVFAVVEFEDGVAIIRIEWGICDENNKIVSSFYPPYENEKQLTRLLLTSNCKRDIKWCKDANGTPYTVIKHLRNAITLQDAMKKCDFYVAGLSELETDDDQNMQNLKGSRHSRKAKTLDSDFTDGDHDSNRTSINRKFTSQLKNPNKNISEQKSEKIASTAIAENFSGEEILVEFHETHEISTDNQIEYTENHESPSKEAEINDNRPRGANVQDLDQDRDENGQLKNIEHANVGRGKKRRSSRFCDDPQEIADWDMSPKDICLFKKINTLGVICEYVASRVGTASQQEITYLNEDVGLSDFPIKTKEHYDEIIEKLMDTEYYTKVVKSIIDLGKLRTLSMTVKSAMKELLTLEAGKLFTFQGRGGKKLRFCGSLLHRVVVQSSRHLHQNEAQSSVNYWIEDWLVQCSNSIKRDKKKEEKRQEKEAEQNFNFPEFEDENSE